MLVMTFLTKLGITWILCIFRLVLEGKAGKEIHESSWLGLFKKFAGYDFGLSDGEDNTFGPLNKKGIADLLLQAAFNANYSLNVC